jgi:hypothetical protein
LRTVAGQAGVDRKTARRYVTAADAAGVCREGGLAQLTDEGIGQVVVAVRPVRAGGHGRAWEALEAEREQISEWVGKDLSVVKIADLLARRGVLAPYRTVHRFCTQRCVLKISSHASRNKPGGTDHVAEGIRQHRAHYLYCPFRWNVESSRSRRPTSAFGRLPSAGSRDVQELGGWGRAVPARLVIHGTF